MAGVATCVALAAAEKLAVGAPRVGAEATARQRRASTPRTRTTEGASR